MWSIHTCRTYPNMQQLFHKKFDWNLERINVVSKTCVESLIKANLTDIPNLKQKITSSSSTSKIKRVLKISAITILKLYLL